MAEALTTGPERRPDLSRGWDASEKNEDDRRAFALGPEEDELRCAEVRERGVGEERKVRERRGRTGREGHLTPPYKESRQ